MMENQQWPSNHQQSVALNVERTDSLNNGNGEFPSDKTDSSENAGKDDPENGINIPEESSVGNGFPKHTISERSQQTIQTILDKIRTLSPLEKFLLYLKLPTEIPNGVDPLRQPLNPLGNRSEIYRTISWIKTHLKEDPETSLPKQEVYNEYNEHCSKIKIKPLSQADFGKVMKQVYPKVRARRLGVRGQSKYCYAGLIRCTNLGAPGLPDADNPVSTEAPCSQSSLALAALFIVKQWSEKQLCKEFSSLEALAFYLVVEHSIGAGTKAANMLKSQSNVQGEDPVGSKNFNKRRETQLQLQKKILEANKKRKRKIQCSKSDEKISIKKSKPQSAVSSTTSAVAPVMRQTSSEMSPPASEGTSASSNSTSPTQGKPICDKSLDFTHLPALPDFNSFQKPALGGGDRSGKVPIPRLGVAPPSSRMPRPPTAKNAKYKAIQPKPCDIASYNLQLQQQGAEIRSQAVHNVDKFIKERKSSDDDCDVPELPLPRERLESISNVEKDAMDEYLGTNSQHEEELSKYFSGENITETPDNTTKLSQLRQYLEQNGIATTESKPVPQNLLQNSSDTIITNEALLESPLVNNPALQSNTAPYIASHNIPAHLINSSARRRVSFETPVHEDTVPPSPNTRRKNFSFTPISPGPQSPNGRQSKSSSTNASPFVSPRNTPVPRCKNNTHQNAGIMLSVSNNLQMSRKNILGIKIKKEPDLQLDMPLELKEELNCNYTTKDYITMSAPPSPRVNSQSMLQKLLNSNNKVSYTPDYINNVQQIQSGNPEMNSILITDPLQQTNDLSFRSQSVPVLAAMRNHYPLDGSFVLAEQNSDFNDLDTIPETQREVNHIIRTLEDPASDASNMNDINVFNITNINAAGNLNQYGLMMENNLELTTDFDAGAVQFEDAIAQEQVIPCVRSLSRSQSMDMVASRSVPSTPLPYTQSINKPLTIKTYPNHVSRSYPSTPIVSTDQFNYNINLNRDPLLNGHPIRSEGIQNNLNGLMGSSDWNSDTNLEQDKDFTIDGQALPVDEFPIVENDNSLVDDNCILISDQNFNSTIN